jgi:hypothetical protein
MNRKEIFPQTVQPMPVFDFKFRQIWADKFEFCKKMAGPITNRLGARFPPDSNCREMKSIEKEVV